MENYEARLKELIVNNTDAMRYLRALSKARLPDAWIAGGYVRSLVWDHLHGYAQPTPVNDIDVIYFDPQSGQEKEREITVFLESNCPTKLWEARNQARMHERNQDKPYSSASDAMRHWLETPTAIGIRLNGEGLLEISAPLGLDDLFQCIARPTAKTLSRPDRLLECKRKIQDKQWQKLWPKLKVLDF